MKLDEARYASRAAYKLDSVVSPLKLDFKNKIILDVGASSGGFSDYALRHGASKVIAVEKGTNQLNPLLLNDPRLVSYEKTDIRAFNTQEQINLALVDVSFISLREILPSVSKLVAPSGDIIAMAKPQFEAKDHKYMHRGVIKNERIRRQILKELERWLRKDFVIRAKADSLVYGTKGNQERFYRLKPSRNA